MAKIETPASDPVRQFSIFIENRVGRLHALTSLLAAHNIHIMAMATLDTTDCAIDRLVVDDPERAREVMAGNNYSFSECDVLVVEFSDESKLKDLLKTLYSVEMNIHYFYSFISRPRNQCALVLSVEDWELASQTLQRGGFKVLSQRDISR